MYYYSTKKTQQIVLEQRVLGIYHIADFPTKHHNNNSIMADTIFFTKYKLVIITAQFCGHLRLCRHFLFCQ